MKLSMELGFGPDAQATCVRWGHSSPSTKGAQHPIFGPCLFNFRPPAGWTKIAVGTEVRVGPGDIVLDGSLAPPKKRGTSPPIFLIGPCLLWPNSWMDQDETWHGGRPRPRPHCVRWGPSSPSPKGAQPQPQSLAHMFVVSKRLDGSIMPLGMEVGHRPVGTEVSVGPGKPLSSQEKGAQHPQFFNWPVSIVAKRLDG